MQNGTVLAAEPTKIGGYPFVERGWLNGSGLAEDTKIKNGNSCRRMLSYDVGAAQDVP